MGLCELSEALSQSDSYDCVRYIPPFILWSSFWDVKKDVVKHGKASADSLEIVFKLRQPSVIEQLIYFCFVCV